MLLQTIESISDAEWNAAVAPYETCTFYHRAEWLELLRQTTGGRILRFRIMNEGDPVGFLACVLLKKGPFRILGSPISGSMTEYLGPIVNMPFDTAAFLEALDRSCRELRVHQVELGGPALDPEVMPKVGYESRQWSTFRIPLSANEEDMWASLTRNCRNRVRKGTKNGLVVENSDDPGFVDLHYQQVRAIFAAQGRTPEFSYAQLKTLVELARPADMVYTLKVVHPDSGKVVATGIFPHGVKHVYSLSVASVLESRDLYPSELLHWTVISMSSQRGLVSYSLGDNYRTPSSGGKFKDKFNGEYELVFRHFRNYSLAAKYARSAYTKLRNLKQRLAISS